MNTNSQRSHKRLGQKHFIALRSLQKAEWHQDDGSMYWRFGRQWQLLYRNGPGWPLRLELYDIVDELTKMGLAEKSIRTCCHHHYGQALWRVTERGTRLIGAAGSTTVLPVGQEHARRPFTLPGLCRSLIGRLIRVGSRGALG